MSYAPGLGVLMTIFLASLAGIPPLGIWIAKLQAFRALIDAGNTAAYVLAIIAAVNTVVAAGYYMRVLRQIWMAPVPDGDTTPIVAPQSIWLALGITAAEVNRQVRATNVDLAALSHASDFARTLTNRAIA
jgi:NADH-quinone oxidoreductase subunit N